MAISGESIDGVEALRIGLVDYLVKQSQFEQDTEVITQRFLELSSEGARQTKLMLSAYQDLPHGQFFEEYLHRQSIAITAPDHDEAMTAYKEKREPVYKSR